MSRLSFFTTRLKLFFILFHFFFVNVCPDSYLRRLLCKIGLIDFKLIEQLVYCKDESTCKIYMKLEYRNHEHFYFNDYVKNLTLV
jgi:hypothetical protein